MKRINLVYLAIIPVLFGIFYINQNYARQAVVFYGFAENKDTEINHDHPVQVNSIYVSPGEFVNKGDLLLEVTHSKYDLELNELTFDLKAMKLQARKRKDEINRDIRKLHGERFAKVNEIELNIERLQSETDLNKSLLKDIKSVKAGDETSGQSANELKMKALKQEREMVLKSYNLEIEGLKEELASVNAPHEVEMQKLESEKEY